MKYTHNKGILLTRLETILISILCLIGIFFITVLALTYFNVDIGIDLSQAGIAGYGRL